jgi:hypothetical protein
MEENDVGIRKKKKGGEKDKRMRNIGKSEVGGIRYKEER